MIHYYIHGRGRGHATRSLVVIRTLRAAGHAVRIFAGEDAQPVFPGDHTPVLSLPKGLGPRVPGLLVRRVQAAGAALLEDRPQLIVSDGDLPPMIAGRGRVPTLALGHGLVFSHCRRPDGAPRGPWLREALKARLASFGASHCVAVNFAQLSPHRPARTTIARPALPADGAPAVSPSAEVVRLAAQRPVLCYFRDDNGEAVVRAAVESEVPVVLFGRNQRGRVPGVMELPFSADDFRYLLSNARAVLSSAGSQLMSECLFHGIPQLALYRAADDEQRLNAYMLRSVASCSRGQEIASCTTADVVDFIAGLPQTRPTRPEGMPVLPVDAVILKLVEAIVADERAALRDAHMAKRDARQGRRRRS